MKKINMKELVEALKDAGYIRMKDMDKMICGGEAWWLCDELDDINQCVGIFTDKKIMQVYYRNDDSCEWSDPKEVFTLSEGYKWLTKVDNVVDCINAAYEMFLPGKRFKHSLIEGGEVCMDKIVMKLRNGKKVTITFEVE